MRSRHSNQCPVTGTQRKCERPALPPLSFPTRFPDAAVRSWQTSYQLPLYAFFTDIGTHNAGFLLTSTWSCYVYFTSNFLKFFLTFPFYTGTRALSLPATHVYFTIFCCRMSPCCRRRHQRRVTPCWRALGLLQIFTVTNILQLISLHRFSPPSHMQMVLISSFFFNIGRPGVDVVGSFQNLILTNRHSGGFTVIYIPASSVQKSPFICILTNI